LDDGKITPDKLVPYLAAHSRTLRTIPPFPQDRAPAELGGNPETTGYQIFRQLDAAHPYSDALPNEKGATVLVWRGLIPPRQPQLAEVKSQVEAAYRESEKKRLFVAMGQRIKAKLATSLKGGADFAKALADATAGEGTVKVDSKSFPSMNLRQHAVDEATGKASDVLLQRAIQEIAALGKGQVADMITLSNDAHQPDKGLLIYVADKKLPDLTPANPEYGATQAELENELAAATGNDTLTEFFTAAMPKGVEAAEAP
jgi:peptidyl-prolyl cis-trans isomerase D